MKLFKPLLYQGRNKKRSYFEGWYFKNVSADSRRVIAFIPGISKGEDAHSFIQIIDGSTGRTWYNRYPAEEFRVTDAPFSVNVGESSFSLDGISVDIQEPEIRGSLTYTDIHPFPRKLFSPGIMGPYTFVPFMECYHGVGSMYHGIAGTLTFENETIDFTDGRGYLEKDWGRSFPETWIWIQGNQFPTQETGLMVSVAKIPWLGSHFNGFLSFFLHKGETHVFATYNRSGLELLDQSPDSIRFALIRGGSRLEVDIHQYSSGLLSAPVEGRMERMIKESVDAKIRVIYSSGGRKVFDETSEHCGSEMNGDVESLFPARKETQAPASGGNKQNEKR